MSIQFLVGYKTNKYRLGLSYVHSMYSLGLSDSCAVSVASPVQVVKV